MFAVRYRAWLLSSPLVVAAFLLAGAPEFPAFERAVAKAFQAAGNGSAGAWVPAPNPTDPAKPTNPANATNLTNSTNRANPANPANPRGALIPLYVSFVALQALDAHSTLRALNAGAAEANPLMSGLAGKPAALLVVKAGLAASTIYLVDKVRLRSRTAAIVLMTALNSAYLTIVAHNYAATP
jgi:hypothetical protein